MTEHTRQDPRAAPLPPQNLDAEEAVLGAILFAGADGPPAAAKVVNRIRDEAGLKPTHFYRASHQLLYRALCDIADQGRPTDVITVAAELRRQGVTEPTQDRIIALAASATAVGSAPHHAREIVRASHNYRAYQLGHRLQQAALNGGVTDALRADMEALLAPHDTEASDRVRVVTLPDFIAADEPDPEPAIGTVGQALLPVGGLLIMGGEGGASKTTLTIDAVAHVASGTPWLGYPVTRPLRVLLVENEGSRSEFKLKLRQKATAWNGPPFAPNVHVWEEPWASFSFANGQHRRELQTIAAEHRIDLVVADPLDSLGVEGAGKPEETRQFIRVLKECGLHNPDRPLAFWLLHHFNKAERKSVVQQLSGAWGGHPDTIIGIEMGDAQTTKLTWAKMRAATPPKQKTIVLTWDVPNRGYTILEQTEFDADKLRAEIVSYVTANPGHATFKIEEAVVGGRRHIREQLEYLASDAGGRLVATGPGDKKTGKYWYPSNHAVFHVATDAQGDLWREGDNDPPTPTGETSRNLSPPDLGATRGDMARTPPPASLSDVAATDPPYVVGEGRGGGDEDAPDPTSPPPAATTPVEDDWSSLLPDPDQP